MHIRNKLREMSACQEQNFLLNFSLIRWGNGCFVSLGIRIPNAFSENSVHKMTDATIQCSQNKNMLHLIAIRCNPAWYIGLAWIASKF